MLIVVAGIGVTGLAVLQFSKKSVSENRDKILIQMESKNQNTDPNATETVQKVPGQLIRTSEHPEAGRPFRFTMTKFGQGATYELEFQGGLRKAFNKDGFVQHTFQKEGPVMVTLFARFEGQEIRLDTLTRIVARRAIKSEIAPIIDY